MRRCRHYPAKTRPATRFPFRLLHALPALDFLPHVPIAKYVELDYFSLFSFVIYVVQTQLLHSKLLVHSFKHFTITCTCFLAAWKDCTTADSGNDLPACMWRYK